MTLCMSVSKLYSTTYVLAMNTENCKWTPHSTARARHQDRNHISLNYGYENVADRHPDPNLKFPKLQAHSSIGEIERLPAGRLSG
jgi:hypothetical protein